MPPIKHAWHPSTSNTKRSQLVPETGEQLAAAGGAVHEEVHGPAVGRDRVVEVIVTLKGAN